MKLDQVRVDPVAAVEGRWFTYVDGFDVLIASDETDDYLRVAAELSRPHLDSIRAGTFTKEQSDDLEKQIAAIAVVKGWRGLEDLEFSQENALRLLRDPGMQRFWRFVRVHSGDESRFRRNAVGNSPALSAGSSTTERRASTIESGTARPGEPASKSIETSAGSGSASSSSTDRPVASTDSGVSLASRLLRRYRGSTSGG